MNKKLAILAQAHTGLHNFMKIGVVFCLMFMPNQPVHSASNPNRSYTHIANSINVSVADQFNVYLPTVSNDWLLTTPRPDNHNSCDAFGIGIATIPAESSNDYYMSFSIATRVKKTWGFVTLYQLPVPATVHMHEVVGGDCSPSAVPRSHVYGITISKDFPVIPKGSQPIVWDTGVDITCRAYVIEVELKGFSSEPYTIGTDFIRDYLNPCYPLIAAN
jgi:hypothetical protein